MKLPTLFSKASKRNPIQTKKKFFGFDVRENWLKEKGIVDREFKWRFNIYGDKNIVSHNFNFQLYHDCYMRVPKVFRAINTRANFAVQGGYKLVGNKADIKKIVDWENKIHFDNDKINIAKKMLLDGNVYIQPVGNGDATELVFLPVETMRVRRNEEGEHLGFVQVIREKVVAEWEKDEIVHIKWNETGISPYGMSEIRPILNVLTDKLDAEAVLPEIVKFHADNRIVWRLGTPDRPYNETQQGAWKSELENRVVAGDVICAGDVDPKVIQPIRGASEVVKILDHIEEQVDTGLNNPQFLTEQSGGEASLNQREAFEREVMTQQDIIGKAITKGIHARVLGKEDVPIIRWNPMNIETRLRGARTLRQLVGDGNAPPIMKVSEARDELGLQEDLEMDDFVNKQAEPVDKSDDVAKPEVPRNGDQDGGDDSGTGPRGDKKKMPQVR